MSANTGPAPSGRPIEKRSAAFLLLFALAHLGGVFGYLPLLSLLLPIKVQAMAGDARLGLFTLCMVTGGIASSASNILFGWLSDRSVRQGKGRRRWIAAGIVASAAALFAVAEADRPIPLVLSVMAVQIAVNLLLAPLIAIMADEIPDSQKGLTGALLSLAFPLAAGGAALMMDVTSLNGATRLAVAALALAICTAPFLATRSRKTSDALPPIEERAMLRRDLGVAWASRILMQVANNVLSTYLFYYFESVASSASPEQLAARVGHVLTIAFLLPVPVTLLIGRLSDRMHRRKPFLLAMAALAVAGLVVMALAEDPRIGAVAYFTYSIGSQAFLALHGAFAMQLLPSPEHRGRDLGLLNLTNTLPALLGPVLTWQLASPHNFTAALLALAGLAALGGLLVLGVRGRR